MKTKKRQSSPLAEQAMHQVLQAERDAEQLITECEVEARQIINDAKTSIQRIETRADQRITNMEMRHEHKLDRLLKSIEAEGQLEIERFTEQRRDSNRLQAIINTLAASLCVDEPANDDTGNDK